MLLSFLIGTVFLLFTHSVVLASGHECDGTLPNIENTCWVFDLGYTVDLTIGGVMENGLQKWAYNVVKKKSASANHILFGLEKDIVIDENETNETDLFPPCVGDTTENVGVGDCLRQFVKWTPNFNTGLAQIILYVKPTEAVSTLPIFAKGSNDVESGTILGPAADKAEVIESTFFIDQTDDGRALAVKMDRNGNIIQAWKCESDCENFPTNFTLITTPTIPLSETYFCIPARDGFDDNSDLTIGGEPVNSLHCGSVEFKDVDSSIQFSNRGSCRVLPSGALYCY